MVAAQHFLERAATPPFKAFKGGESSGSSDLSPDQLFQFRESVNQEIRLSILEGFGRIPVGNSARGNACIAAGEDVYRRVADHPRPFTMAFSVG